MKYVVSDLHGCYELWLKGLEEIGFSESKDEMFVLGDVIDKGERPIDLLFDIMRHKRVHMINGNHELDFLNIWSVIDKRNPTIDDCIKYDMYLTNGGESTVKQFRELTPRKRQKVLKFLQARNLYVETGRCVLIHGGISNFSTEKELKNYSAEELTIHRYKTGECFYEDKVLICGHTPTINRDRRPAEIFISQDGRFYNIDCGCVFPSDGGRLAILRLDTLEPIYIS